MKVVYAVNYEGRKFRLPKQSLSTAKAWMHRYNKYNKHKIATVYEVEKKPVKRRVARTTMFDSNFKW